MAPMMRGSSDEDAKPLAQLEAKLQGMLERTRKASARKKRGGILAIGRAAANARDKKKRKVGCLAKACAKLPVPSADDGLDVCASPSAEAPALEPPPPEPLVAPPCARASSA